jgi:hypothetical protein
MQNNKRPATRLCFGRAAAALRAQAGVPKGAARAIPCRVLVSGADSAWTSWTPRQELRLEHVPGQRWRRQAPWLRQSLLERWSYPRWSQMRRWGEPPLWASWPRRQPPEELDSADKQQAAEGEARKGRARCRCGQARGRGVGNFGRREEGQVWNSGLTDCRTKFSLQMDLARIICLGAGSTYLIWASNVENSDNN